MPRSNRLDISNGLHHVTMPNHASTSLCHPTETSALTLCECDRVQEFPNEWQFSGTLLEQYTRVGSAVPVRLGRVCGETVATLLDQIQTCDRDRVTTDAPPCRIVYLKSHVRTRQWFKQGQTFLWQDGDNNEHVKYGLAKTPKKVRPLGKTPRLWTPLSSPKRYTDIAGDHAYISG